MLTLSFLNKSKGFATLSLQEMSRIKGADGSSNASPADEGGEGNGGIDKPIIL